MISAILILLMLPLINTSQIRSSKFRPIFGVAYWFLVSDFILLGWIGQKPVESPYIEIGMGATIFYFLFLLVLVPVIGYIENQMIVSTDSFIELEISKKDDLSFGKLPNDLEEIKNLEKHPRLYYVNSTLPVNFDLYTGVILYI